MLNISDNSVRHLVPAHVRDKVEDEQLPLSHRYLTRYLIVFGVLALVMLFLPWQQNIQSTGEVTTLDPSQRPQTVDATIAGRLEEWYVREGQQVKSGDTIARLSEIKTDYFDPQLVDRAGNQLTAKEQTIGSYDDKAGALANQIAALQQSLILKTEQLAAKVAQTERKLASQEADAEQAEIGAQIAATQLARVDTLFKRGIKSRTDFEDKNQAYQEKKAKAISARNKVAELENELSVAQLEERNIRNEFSDKIAKARSDRFSTLSDRYAAEGDLAKMETQYENYARRSAFYYITAPQDAYITKTLVAGVGMTVKEGEAIANIMPVNYQLAVAMYIKPFNLALIRIGQEVRFMFDGWPAIVFSGWPNQQLGTFTGQIVAIDNDISANGMYRVLVTPSAEDEPWPIALRPGSGAKGIAYMEWVPVWYELWRQINGFPPEFYDNLESKPDKIKQKAPVKSLK